MTSEQLGSLEVGAVVRRRYDNSRWRVLAVETRDRQDPILQHTMGPIVEAKLRRVSPEVISAYGDGSDMYEPFMEEAE